MSTAATAYHTVEEYLALEETSEVRHEYFDGEIFAMPAATESHNLVVGNVITSLNKTLEARPCRVYPSNMRIKCPPGRYVYPDVSITCEEPEFDPPEKRNTLLNPLVVIEVLSPSTEDYDHGKKFASYRQLPSLEEYVLLSQDWPHVEHFRRQETSHEWLMTETDGLDETLSLPAVGVELSLRELYAKVSLVEPA